VEYKGWFCCSLTGSWALLLFVAAVGFVLASERCRLDVQLSFRTAHRVVVI